MQLHSIEKISLKNNNTEIHTNTKNKLGKSQNITFKLYKNVLM